MSPVLKFLFAIALWVLGIGFWWPYVLALWALIVVLLFEEGSGAGSGTVMFLNEFPPFSFTLYMIQQRWFGLNELGMHVLQIVCGIISFVCANKIGENAYEKLK